MKGSAPSSTRMLWRHLGRVITRGLSCNTWKPARSRMLMGILLSRRLPSKLNPWKNERWTSNAQHRTSNIDVAGLRNLRFNYLDIPLIFCRFVTRIGNQYLEYQDYKSVSSSLPIQRSMLDVRCWTFDVRCSKFLYPIGKNLAHEFVDPAHPLHYRVHPRSRTTAKKSGLALVLTRFIIYNNLRLLKNIDFQKP